ncbi:MAG TPA: OmpA family protein [Bacteroidota bacterium]|nr:OmpA family protein [Bacteroidota bacterium]
MKRMLLTPILTCLLYYSIGAATLFAQDNLRNQLFGEADQLLSQAKEKKAEFYAPASYDKAMRYYNDAMDFYNRGRGLEDIRERVKNASAYFAKSLDVCKSSEAALSSTMAARTDATSAGALKSSPELWNKAEEKFKRAARELEDNNLNNAKDDASSAQTMYRDAELEAIKANFLTPARDLLKRADEMSVNDQAPKTLLKAQRLTKQVEDLLTQKRYDTDEARVLAQEAKYEAAHAIYLYNRIKQLKKDDKTFEDVMTEDEAQFQRVAGPLGVQSRFDNGYDGPVAEINSAMKVKDAALGRSADSLRQMSDAIRGRDNEAANLREQVGLMEKRLGTLSEAEKQLQDAGKDLERRLLFKQQQEQTIRDVSAKFTEDEANMVRDRDNLIIRLYGLSFPVGSSTIESQYYTLLTKVQDVIKKFPNSKVTIEGHTDSQGTDDANQTLSDSRAKAVAEYLMANMGVSLPINYQGYGESRPIASNDTPEGRAKNRRIDVVITPEWAGAAK